jgi:hypothetical protein
MSLVQSFLFVFAIGTSLSCCVHGISWATRFRRLARTAPVISGDTILASQKVAASYAIVYLAASAIFSMVLLMGVYYFGIIAR